MKQQDILRQAIRITAYSRATLASELGVSKRALDKWLLPETSGDFRRMPETVARLLAIRFAVRKSANLSLPYDWSDPAMTDDKLIIAVLRRARFPDLVRICLDYGISTVKARLPYALAGTPESNQAILSRILARMLRNIEIAFAKQSSA